MHAEAALRQLLDTVCSPATREDLDELANRAIGFTAELLEERPFEKSPPVWMEIPRPQFIQLTHVVAQLLYAKCSAALPALRIQGSLTDERCALYLLGLLLLALQKHDRESREGDACQH